VRISVVVATYQRPACLARCLGSLAAQERPADEVIVVGQGDDRRSRRVVSEAARVSAGGTAWTYLHLARPNIAAAENAGVASARGDVVAFIDDDAASRPAWLRVMERWYEDPEVGGAGGPYVEHEGGAARVEFARRVGVFKWYGRYVSRQWCLTPGPQRVHVLSGSNMSYRRHLLPEIPEAILPYWNAFEVFWAGAVRRRGFHIVFDPALRVDHYRDERRRFYNFACDTDRELRRTLYRNHAHNFVYAALMHGSPPAKLPFLAYEVLVGERGRLGPLRAAVLWAEGGGDEASEALGPSLQGRFAGLRSYLRDRRGSRRHGGAGRARLSTPARITVRDGICK
jgi:glycosyltransferase involved in cell wall biosynthesis